MLLPPTVSIWARILSPRAGHDVTVTVKSCVTLVHPVLLARDDYLSGRSFYTWLDCYCVSPDAHISYSRIWIIDRIHYTGYSSIGEITGHINAYRRAAYG